MEISGINPGVLWPEFSGWKRMDTHQEVRAQPEPEEASERTCIGLDAHNLLSATGWEATIPASVRAYAGEGQVTRTGKARKQRSGGLCTQVVRTSG